MFPIKHKKAADSLQHRVRAEQRVPTGGWGHFLLHQVIMVVVMLMIM